MEILAYLDLMHISYQFAPPHEHDILVVSREKIELRKTNYRVFWQYLPQNLRNYGYTHKVMLYSNWILSHVNIYHGQRLILSGLEFSRISTIKLLKFWNFNHRLFYIPLWRKPCNTQTSSRIITKYYAQSYPTFPMSSIDLQDS